MLRTVGAEPAGAREGFPEEGRAGPGAWSEDPARQHLGGRTRGAGGPEPTSRSRGEQGLALLRGLLRGLAGRQPGPPAPQPPGASLDRQGVRTLLSGGHGAKLSLHGNPLADGDLGCYGNLSETKKYLGGGVSQRGRWWRLQQPRCPGSVLCPCQGPPGGLLHDPVRGPWGRSRVVSGTLARSLQAQTGLQGLG